MSFKNSGEALKRRSGDLRSSFSNLKLFASKSSPALSELQDVQNLGNGGKGKLMEHFPFGLCNIPAEKDQDRFHMLHNARSRRQSIDVDIEAEGHHCEFYSIFDGHGTSPMAADVCAKDLFTTILDANRRIKGTRDVPVKSEGLFEVADELVEHSSDLESSAHGGVKNLSTEISMLPDDQAITEGFEEIDNRIKKLAKKTNTLRTGSCAVCLFLEPIHEIVDQVSREKLVAEAGSLVSATTATASNAPIPIAASPIPTNLQFQIGNSIQSNLSQLSMNDRSFIVSMKAKIAWVGDSRCVVFDTLGNVVESTEDHRVDTNENERRRISLHMKSSKPRDGFLDSAFWRQEQIEAPKYGRIARATSFIGQRQLPSGEFVGSRVLFSYSNGVSLQVSRSIGDPLAARSAICHPEIKTFNLTLDFSSQLYSGVGNGSVSSRSFIRNPFARRRNQLAKLEKEFIAGSCDDMERSGHSGILPSFGRSKSIWY